MSPLNPALCAFLILNSIIRSCTALDRGTIQLDLIFPRNGSISKPTWPFPIVFAVHNIDRIWNLEPLIEWEFSGPWDSNGTDPRWTDWGTRDAGSYPWDISNPLQGAKTPLTAPPPTFVVVNGTQALHYQARGQKSRESLPGRYKLQYTIDIGHHGPLFNPSTVRCMALQNDGLRLQAENYTRSTPSRLMESIFFELSMNGTIPDVLSGGKCSQALGTLSIPSIGIENGATECPVLAMSAPKGEDCLYQIEEPLMNNVSTKMLEIIVCNETEYYWPNKTFNNLTCAEARQQAQKGLLVHPRKGPAPKKELAMCSIILVAGMAAIGFSVL